MRRVSPGSHCHSKSGGAFAYHFELERCVHTSPLSGGETRSKCVAEGHRIGKSDKAGT